MYIRDEQIKKQVGSKLVPYCADCECVEVETIQTCKHCGSHNIKFPNINDDNMNLGIVPEYHTYTAKIYKCDKCGDEFDGKKIDKYISWCDGEFESFKVSEEQMEFDGDSLLYYLDYDLCAKCKQEIVNKLRLKLLDFINPGTIKKQVKGYVKGDEL